MHMVRSNATLIPQLVYPYLYYFKSSLLYPLLPVSANLIPMLAITFLFLCALKLSISKQWCHENEEVQSWDGNSIIKQTRFAAPPAGEVTLDGGAWPVV